jgi:hypothetical protein
MTLSNCSEDTVLKISRDRGVELSISSCFGETLARLVRAAQRRKMSVFVFFIVGMGCVTSGLAFAMIGKQRRPCVGKSVQVSLDVIYSIDQRLDFCAKTIQMGMGAFGFARSDEQHKIHCT